MVHFAQVHELVINDVVANKGRRLHEPPVERDDAGGGARAPSGALVAHGNPGDGHARLGGKLPSARGELDFRDTQEMRLERGAQIGGDVGDAKNIRVQERGACRQSGGLQAAGFEWILREILAR